MKILYIHQYFTFPTGSGGTRSYDLAKKFIQAGHKVEFITTSTNLREYKFSKGWNLIEKDGLKLHVYKLTYRNSMGYLERTLVFIKFLWHASFKALKINCDLVLATSTPLTVGIPAIIKKKKNGTPFIFEARDVWPEAVIAIGAIKNPIIQKMLFWLEAKIYKSAVAIVPLSTDMKKSITSRFPKLNKPVEVIENISSLERFTKGINPERSLLFEKLGIKPRFSILYAGTFGRVNGIDYVVRLAAKVLPLDPGIIFILIGGGALKEEVTDLAKKLVVLNKNVFILDAISKDELPQWYHECQMGSSFVIPIKELWANSANKFFDTLAAGKPVLINHEGWQKDIIENENAGFVLPDNERELTPEFIGQFVSYTKNEVLISKQQKNARLLAEKYSLEEASKKYLELFETISR
jgi:glycosyltransferase involved in cell wall biosynthesis